MSTEATVCDLTHDNFSFLAKLEGGMTCNYSRLVSTAGLYAPPHNFSSVLCPSFPDPSRSGRRRIATWVWPVTSTATATEPCTPTLSSTRYGIKSNAVLLSLTGRIIRKFNSFLWKRGGSLVEPRGASPETSVVDLRTGTPSVVA